MNIREGWAKSVIESGKEVWELERKDDAVIFETKTKIVSGTHGNEDFLGRSPMFHVWKGDEWLYCGANMKQAYDKYYEALKDS